MNLIGILKPIVGRMPLYAKLLYTLYSDPSVGRRRKVLLIAGLIYTISPIDLVPGFIPVIGQLDDIIIVLSSLLGELKRTPAEKRDEYLSRAGLRMEVIERDIEAAKAVMLYIATRPIACAGRGIRWTGRKAGGLIARWNRRLRDRK